MIPHLTSAEQKGRAYQRFILRQLSHLHCKRSAAFRPLLTKGLALSGDQSLTKASRHIKHLSIGATAKVVSKIAISEGQRAGTARNKEGLSAVRKRVDDTIETQITR